MKTRLIGVLLIAAGGVLLYLGFAAHFGLWIGGWAAIVAGLFVLVLGGMVTAARERSKLIATGRPGVATVVAFRDTGTTVNDNPRVEFELRVAPGDGAPAFDVTTSQVVSRLQPPRTGQRFPVRYDPGDPTRLAILGPTEAPDDLDKLLQLRQSGVITEDEYTALVKRIGTEQSEH